MSQTDEKPVRPVAPPKATRNHLVIAKKFVVATAQGLWFGVRWTFTNLINPLVRWAYRSADRLLSKFIPGKLARHAVMAAAAGLCLIAGVVVIQSLSDQTPKAANSDTNAKTPLALATAPSATATAATTPTQATANTPPRVPGPEVVQPATGTSPLPATDSHVAAIVDQLTASTSRAYAERGYAGFRFGMTRAEVEAITKTELQRSWDPGWMTSDGHGRQQFVFDGGGRLVVVKMGYIGNTELHLGNVTELFGKPSKSQVTQFSSPRSEGYMWHFWFPLSFAAVEVRADQDQVLLVQVIDFNWASVRLREYLSRQRSMCMWLAEVLRGIEAGRITPARLPEYPQGQIVVINDGFSRIVCSHPKGQRMLLEYTSLISRTPGQVVRQIKLSVNFYALASEEDSLMLSTRLSPIAIDAVCQLAQELFPPSGETIHVLTRKDTGGKSYEWLTASGWKVSVGADNTLTLIKDTGGELQSATPSARKE